MTPTLSYYDANADTFYASTVSADISITQKLFASMFSPGANILDFGCGSGRDTKFFLQSGFRVEATDGSAKLCKLASEYTGIPVRQMLFSELSEIEKYDGIWACASILHLPKNELKNVFQRMSLAIKKKGIIYTSFKYGSFEGERNGRYFTDFTEENFIPFIQEISLLSINDIWITNDVRPGRGKERWLNLLLFK